MKLEPPVGNAQGPTMVLRRFIAWAVFFSAYLFFMWARWPSGPGTLGYYFVVVGLCLIAATVASIATAVATVRHFRTLPWPLTILGIVPLTCTVAVFVLGPPEFR